MNHEERRMFLFYRETSPGKKTLDDERGMVHINAKRRGGLVKNGNPR